MKCPKCDGGSMGNPAYCGGMGSQVTAMLRQPTGPCPTGEHLHRTCNACGYKSADACADAEEMAAKARSDARAGR
jgi:hypothetical protein